MPRRPNGGPEFGLPGPEGLFFGSWRGAWVKKTQTGSSIGHNGDSAGGVIVRVKRLGCEAIVGERSRSLAFGSDLCYNTNISL